MQEIQTTEDLLNRFSQSLPFKQLSEAIRSGQSVQVKGLMGSQPAFVAGALSSVYAGNILLIYPDKESAAYALNDLEALGSKNVNFFPATIRKPYNEQKDEQSTLLRAELLNLLNQSQKQQLIVSYPEALFEKVTTRKTLVKNTFVITKGEKLDSEFLHEFLEDCQFERVDFVAEPGQYAIRGGILDVFSYSNDNPYRIEFFDDEVESIRSFDVLTQLSITEQQFISIVPDVQGKLLQESRQSFLEFMSESTLVFLKDTDFVLQKMNKDFAQAQQTFKHHEGLIQPIAPEELYVSGTQTLEELKRFVCIEHQRGAQVVSNENIVLFDAKPQTSFNKNFELIASELADNLRRNIKNFIFSDNPKQIERIEAIFQDIGKNISFTPMFRTIGEGFIDIDLRMAFYTDHQLFDRYHRFKLKDGFSRKEAITLKELQELMPGDYVTHVDHGIGKYAGLEKIEVNGKMQEAIRLVYKDNDMLYVNIHSLHRISKYSGKEGAAVKMNKLGTNAWSQAKARTKSRVKDIAKDLIELYAKRRSQPGFKFSPDTYLQTELEASFIYEDTPDQLKATKDIKRDMEKPYPMDRLVCGDVGFGKTEVAVRAAFKAVNDSKQVAVLVPTTILALQHYKTFASRLEQFPVKVDYINRFKSAKEQKETLAKLEKGEIDIIIGTHRLISKDVKFKDLGLMIIDEEQKFGVSAKEKLKHLRVNVDSLTLTATPIPRTLHFSMMGARDLSVISTPPPNRFPVNTELHTFNEELIRNAVTYEVQRGGQVFFVHNRVGNIQQIADMILRLCPGVKVCIGHGQMEPEDLEKVMFDFINHEYDVLVATTIIESGLDIPNANTIIINDAHLFGLSDLHQIRGRVGRSNKKAFCYLMSTPVSLLTPDARKRLKAIEDFADLGSGFNIAMRDLDIRGAGNLLGSEQSGFIAEVGFEMYQKILDEAIQELKENEFKDLFKEELEEKQYHFVADCQIDTDLELLIPDSYVSNIGERLLLYKDLDNCKDEKDLHRFSINLQDRFGPVPKVTEELIQTVRMRWMAEQLGIEKIVLKQKTMIAYFIQNQQSAFYSSPLFAQIIQYINQGRLQGRLREKNNKLGIFSENVKNISQVVSMFQSLMVYVGLINEKQASTEKQDAV